MNKDDVYLIGDVRYTEKAGSFYQESEKAPIEFLLKLQNLMEEFGILKLDICMDALKVKNIIDNGINTIKR